MRSLLVAVIDDDISHYLSLKLIIERLPVVATTVYFADGQEAYDYLVKNASNQAQIPDYLFLDVYMPKMDGWEFLDKLGELAYPKKISTYIISGSNEHKKRALSHLLVKGYLRKPISESEIREIFPDMK